jgi:membrane protein required for colicin V production
LGFFYGLGRGLVLVVIAYLFYGWLIPYDRQEDWVKNARSLPVIQSVGEVILSLVPPDIAETLTNSSILTNQTPAQPQPQQPPATQAGSSDTATPPADEEGYKKNESQGLDQLIQGTQGQQSSPPPDDNQEQPDFGGQSNPN